MPAFPSTRPRRVVLGVAALLLVVSSPLWWGKAVFLFNLAFPGPVYERAARRDSDPAPLGGALAVPVTVVATEPTGTDPAIALRRIAEVAIPTSVADPPGPGPVLVTTQLGELIALDLRTGQQRLVFDMAEEIGTGGLGGERGLLGAAVDPDGARLYLSYTNGDGDPEIRSWPMGEDGLPVGEPDDGVLHLRIGHPFANHNGGNLVFGPDGALWIGTGDGGGAGDRGDVALDPRRLLGKILRVLPDPAGGVLAPSTNPAWDGRPEVWAIGLRNPWRYSFDRATHRLWIGDVGQDAVEEVSVIDPDADRPNFGWSDVEGNNDYHGSARPEFTAPVITYGHDEGCSVTGGFVYRGEDLPGLYGWYLFGDYCGGFVRAVPAEDPEQDPTVLLTGIGPVTSFAELEDGELLVLGADGISAVVAPSYWTGHGRFAPSHRFVQVRTRDLTDSEPWRAQARTRGPPK